MSFYGIAVRRGGIESPYEFCSINSSKGTTTVLTSLWVTLIGCWSWPDAGQRSRAVGRAGRDVRLSLSACRAGPGVSRLPDRSARRGPQALARTCAAMVGRHPAPDQQQRRTRQLSGESWSATALRGRNRANWRLLETLEKCC